MGIRSVSQIQGNFKLEKHFKNENKDNIQPFTVTTRAGNVMEGFINLERNEKYGQLIVEKVNGKKAPQIIWGIPKIKYPYIEGADGPIKLPQGKMFFREKLDGTNISVYPIKLDGKIIDVEYKTRRLPLAAMSSSFIDGDNLVKFIRDEYPQIEEIVKQTGYTLSFEIYGKNNMHMVRYEESMALSLLVALDNNKNGKIVDYDELKQIAKENKLPIPQEHLIIDIENNSIQLTPYFQERYQYTGFNKRVYKDNDRLYRDVQNIYESINKRDSYKDPEHFSLEGSVIFISGDDGKNTLWKCKAPSVEEYHMKLSQLNTIPDENLAKAVDKTRENLTLEELADLKTAVSFMQEELGEELPESTILRNAVRITNAIKDASRDAAMLLKIQNSGINLNGEPKDVIPQLKEKFPGAGAGYLFSLWQKLK